MVKNDSQGPRSVVLGSYGEKAIWKCIVADIIVRVLCDVGKREVIRATHSNYSKFT